MDIEGLGEKRVVQLVEAGLLSDPGDIYALRSGRASSALERFGDLSVDNLIGAIEASKSRPLSRLLVGLGVRHLGPTGSRALARATGSLDALMAASVDELAVVEGIGPVIADSVVEFLASPANRHVIDKLRAAGVDLGEPGARPRATWRCGATSGLLGRTGRTGRSGRSGLLAPTMSVVTADRMGREMGPSRRWRAARSSSPAPSRATPERRPRRPSSPGAGNPPAACRPGRGPWCSEPSPAPPSSKRPRSWEFLSSRPISSRPSSRAAKPPGPQDPRATRLTSGGRPPTQEKGRR